MSDPRRYLLTFTEWMGPSQKLYQEHGHVGISRITTISYFTNLRLHVALGMVRQYVESYNSRFRNAVAIDMKLVGVYRLDDDEDLTYGAFESLVEGRIEDLTIENLHSMGDSLQGRM